MCVCTCEAVGHYISAPTAVCKLFLVWIAVSLGTIAMAILEECHCIIKDTEKNNLSTSYLQSYMFEDGGRSLEKSFKMKSVI